MAPDGDRTVMVTSCGSLAALFAVGPAAADKGVTSTRQRWPMASPVKPPPASSSVFGRPLATARVVSTSATCCSSERTPRTEVAITAPIAASDAATTASATSASMMVKPALLRRSERVAGDNFDSSGQPVDAYLVAHSESGQRNGAAA